MLLFTNIIIRLIWAIVVGAIAGTIACKIMKSRGDILFNIALGFAGSIVGSLVFGIIGLGATNWIGELLLSVIGACLVIGVARFFRR